ncbi:hypothetical protein AB0C96_09395 [Streptomyces sp. NPDC048506]|uniref:hypothetical protein n=1 Tax=Streptomyces sp. NPDC048506 TaxID=3155028 RepID=UPI003431675B
MTDMRLLQRVRDDLSTGENPEIYVTALLSLTLAVLGAFSVASGEVLSAATLTMFALLAGSLLGGWQQVAEFAAQIWERALAEVSVEDFFWYGHFQAECERVRRSGARPTPRTAFPAHRAVEKLYSSTPSRGVSTSTSPQMIDKHTEYARSSVDTSGAIQIAALALHFPVGE